MGLKFPHFVANFSKFTGGEKSENKGFSKAKLGFTALMIFVVTFTGCVFNDVQSPNYGSGSVKDEFGVNRDAVTGRILPAATPAACRQYDAALQDSGYPTHIGDTARQVGAGAAAVGAFAETVDIAKGHNGGGGHHHDSRWHVRHKGYGPGRPGLGGHHDNRGGGGHHHDDGIDGVALYLAGIAINTLGGAIGDAADGQIYQQRLITLWGECVQEKAYQSQMDADVTCNGDDDRCYENKEAAAVQSVYYPVFKYGQD